MASTPMASTAQSNSSAKRERARNITALGVFAGMTASAALIGSASIASSGRWYEGLRKPRFAPPKDRFKPGRAGLYAMMAISGFRVWKAAPSRRRSAALGLWATQLVLNAAWTPIVFRGRSPLAGLVDALALAGTAIAYTAVAREVDRRASSMMLPYLGWLAYVGLVNEEIVRLGRKRR